MAFAALALKTPQEQRPQRDDGREVDARRAERHHQPETFQAAVVCEQVEKSEAAARHVRAQEQRLVAGVPAAPVAARVVQRLAVAVDHEYAVLVSGTDQDWQAEEV